MRIKPLEGRTAIKFNSQREHFEWLFSNPNKVLFNEKGDHGEFYCDDRGAIICYMLNTPVAGMLSAGTFYYNKDE